jgi:hypothetical protein
MVAAKEKICKGRPEIFCALLIQAAFQLIIPYVSKD